MNFVDDSVLSLLERVEQYYAYVKQLKKYSLPIPPCVSNEFFLIMEHLKTKWLTDFPNLDYVCKELEKDNYMFSVPFEEYHYLYYHMLRACRRLQEANIEFRDFLCVLPYSDITDYLSKKKEDATVFFERYLRVNRETLFEIRNTDVLSEGKDNPDGNVQSVENKDTEIISKELKNVVIEVEDNDEGIDTKSLKEGDKKCFVIQRCQGCQEP